ncbi:MAG TPA: hypothetical protein VGS22_13715 [Thermoanaerobaculia bacterium]|jgi:hypothetical protein|nr:hypothetical protein [Thermoanaerobaculia bacterium]
MIAPTRSGPSAPCGCGGHASSSASAGSGGHGGCGCGCGGTDCGDGVVVRPLFFAGQLLTEEDLQALTEYVAVKSRLHNRHLFGAGVVCGFEVACHPCGGGKVVVQPGHALDCCGNEIVLSCPQTLDVNAMARDLKARLQGGVDCGDPCDPPQLGAPRRSYALFVRYAETQTDPVSAFLTDEPCVSTGCQPTRLREGLRFELRCHEAPKPPGDALCRIASCLGGPELLDTLVSLDHVVERSKPFLLLEREQVQFSHEALDQVQQKVLAAIAAWKARPSAQSFLNTIGLVAVVRVLLDRYLKLPPSARTDADKDSVEVIAKVVALLAQDVFAQTPTGLLSRLEVSFSRRIVEDVQTRLDEALPDPARGTLWKYPDLTIPALDERRDDTLCLLHGRLLDRLDGTPGLADCALREEARTLPVHCPPLDPPKTLADWLGSAQSLVAAWRRVWQDCAARALLPPCPPCDDPGVLLATLDVESCAVQRVCNLARTIVASPVALRHWLPLDGFHRLAAALCRTDPGALASALPGPTFASVLAQLCPAARDQADLAATLLWDLGREVFVPHPRLADTPSVPPERAEPGEPLGSPAAAIALERLEAELKKQEAKNAQLEKRLKALEGRKKP